jgi:hypothetical protein
VSSWSGFLSLVLLFSFIVGRGGIVNLVRPSAVGMIGGVISAGKSWVDGRRGVVVVEVAALGHPAGVSTDWFPRAASRTRRAPFPGNVLTAAQDADIGRHWRCRRDSGISGGVVASWSARCRPTPATSGVS